MKNIKSAGFFKAFGMLALVVSLGISCTKTDQDKASFELLESNGKTSGKVKSSEALLHDWYRLHYQILKANNSSANGTLFAFMGIGLYESVRHGIPNSKSLTASLTGMPSMPEKEKNQGYFWDVAANAALADLTRGLFKVLTPADLQSISELEQRWNASLNPSEQSASFKRSRSYGKAVAAVIVEWFMHDDLNQGNTNYAVPTGELWMWSAAPTNFSVGVNPYVGNATTLLAVHATKVSQPFPIPFDTDPNSAFYLMAKEIHDFGVNQTAPQLETARFWLDGPSGVGITPSGHQMSVVTQALEQSGKDLFVSAEAYAKAGIAQRDAFIVCFRSKYLYNWIRPVTYIKAYINSAWNSSLTTPPHPEYPSGHSVITSATLRAAATVIGADVPVTDKTYLPLYAARNYSSLDAAALDAGLSRLYGGFHFRKTFEISTELGREIGNNVGAIILH